MQLNKLDIRELKSFKLRSRTLTLNNFFEQESNVSIFMMTDSVQPVNRIELRKYFAIYNLNLSFVSKKTLNLLMKNFAWHNLKNLLSGNVLRITPKTKIESEAKLLELLDFLLKQKTLDLRCLVWNNQIYRKEHLKDYFMRSNNNFKEDLINKTLKTPIIQSPLVMGLFFSQTHYK